MRETNSMVEEFMLAANISAAERIYQVSPLGFQTTCKFSVGFKTIGPRLEKENWLCSDERVCLFLRVVQTSSI